MTDEIPLKVRDEKEYHDKVLRTYKFDQISKSRILEIDYTFASELATYVHPKYLMTAILTIASSEHFNISGKSWFDHIESDRGVANKAILNIRGFQRNFLQLRILAKIIPGIDKYRPLSYADEEEYSVENEVAWFTKIVDPLSKNWYDSKDEEESSKLKERFQSPDFDLIQEEVADVWKELRALSYFLQQKTEIRDGTTKHLMRYSLALFLYFLTLFRKKMPSSQNLTGRPLDSLELTIRESIPGSESYKSSLTITHFQSPSITVNHPRGIADRIQTVHNFDKYEKDGVVPKLALSIEGLVSLHINETSFRMPFPMARPDGYKIGQVTPYMLPFKTWSELKPSHYPFGLAFDRVFKLMFLNPAVYGKATHEVRRLFHSWANESVRDAFLITPCRVSVGLAVKNQVLLDYLSQEIETHASSFPALVVESRKTFSVDLFSDTVRVRVTLKSIKNEQNLASVENAINEFVKSRLEPHKKIEFFVYSAEGDLNTGLSNVFNGLTLKGYEIVYEIRTETYKLYVVNPSLYIVVINHKFTSKEKQKELLENISYDALSACFLYHVCKFVT